MKNIAKTSVNKPMTVLMGMLIVILLGVVSLTKLSLELFPEMNLPFAVVVTTYEGANPYEVEEDATKPLEQNILSINNVKNVTSTSSEHFSIVMVEFQESTNMNTAFLEMRESFQRLEFKEGVGNPMIIKFDPDMMPVMVVSLTRDWGDISDEEALIKTTEWVNEEVLNKLERIPGVASVRINGASDTVIEVDLNDDVLKSYNLTQQEVLRIIEAQNIEGLTGVVPDAGNIRMLYIGNKIVGLDELKTTPIYFDVLNSKMITLQDLADHIGFVNAATNQYNKINGKQGITINFQKQSDVGITEVVNAIQETLDDITSANNAEYKELLNQGNYIERSIGSVTNNLIVGSILAIVILFFFLRDIRPTLIVGLAIPISVIGAFALMYLSDISLNIISMGGLALGIGMLVDNSIVVIENIYRLRSEGKSAKQAAILGAGQVAGAITSSTLTTVSVFLPIVFVEGMIAELFTTMALTVTYSLVASLIIAITLVPSLSSRTLTNVTAKEGRITKALQGAYEKSVRFALRKKAFVLIVITLLLGLSGFLAYSKGFELMPTTDEGSITVNIEMVKGTSFDQTAELTDLFTKEILALEDVDTVSAQIGGSGFLRIFSSGSTDSASITIRLKDERKLSTAEVSNQIEKIKNELDYTALTNVTPEDVYGIEVSMQDRASMAGFGSTGIQIVIKGENLYDMRDIADQLVNINKNVAGTKDWDNGIAQTDDIIRIQVNKENAIKKGLTEADVKSSINIFYKAFGFDMTVSENTKLMIKVNGIDYEITVPSSGFTGFNTTYEQFLSQVRVFNYYVTMAIENKFNEDDSFLLYYVNRPFFDPAGTIPNPLFDSSKPLGAVLINPMLRYNPLTNEVYTVVDILTDTNPTLDSLGTARVYEGNTDTSIANVIKDAGFNSIVRDGKTRVLTISANVLSDYKINEVASIVEKNINDYLNSSEFINAYGDSGITVQIAGENEDIKNMTNDMMLAGAVAILLVYMIMVIQFQSLKYPFIVMFTIPLAFTGGFFALFITGLPIGMVAMVGLIILTGIVVNNGIVLIDYINQLREGGMPTTEAIVEAGKTRLRPILMTALTTILALIMMALGVGEGGELLQPLGITSIGGLIYATILTLIVIPVMYSIMSRKEKVVVKDDLDVE